MRKRFSCFFLLAMSVILILCLSGMTRSGHIAEWERVFGFATEPGDTAAKQRLDTIYNVVSNAIDTNTKGISDELRKFVKSADTGQEFSQGRHLHAIFFHWAFNDSPEKHKAFVDRLKRCGLSKADYNTAMGKVEKEWNKRKNACIEAVARQLGVDKKTAAAIACLLHDTHILADYMANKRTGALSPMRNLQNDLMTHGIKVLVAGNPQHEAVLNKITDVGTSINNRVVAEKLMTNLSVYLPQILVDKCGEQLAKHGIRIEPQAGTK